jgi:hypothetical protein
LFEPNSLQLFHSPQPIATFSQPTAAELFQKAQPNQTHWNHQVHPMEEDLEESGPFALLILLVVGYQQRMLDCRPASQAVIASSDCLPVL